MLAYLTFMLFMTLLLIFLAAFVLLPWKSWIDALFADEVGEGAKGKGMNVFHSKNFCPSQSHNTSQQLCEQLND